MTGGSWELIRGEGPLVATAIHNGHAVREEIAKYFAISEEDRLREEDPFTGLWTEIADTRIIGNVSRFEVDLNRPREKAVYIKPDDAWGLRVWKKKPSKDLIAGSLEKYDAFYSMAETILGELEGRFGHFLVLDLHSYNHRRGGPESPAADREANPEINIGTGTMDQGLWGALVRRFMNDLGNYEFDGRRFDVRENIKFRGGQFSKWIHERFPRSGCALAIEFKKFFMDEWTGKLYRETADNIHRALQSTVPGIREELEKLKSSR